MTNEVIIRCQKNTRGWYTAYTRVRLYTPNTPLEPIKNLGPGQDLGGLCPPRPQPKNTTEQNVVDPRNAILRGCRPLDPRKIDTYDVEWRKKRCDLLRSVFWRDRKTAIERDHAAIAGDQTKV